MAVPAIIEGIVSAIKGLTNVCDKMVDGADAQKYADSVQTLNKNVDETYNQMRQLIINDDKLTQDQKLAKLEKLAKSQLSANKSCQDAIKGNRENASRMIGEFFLALATCGISYLPKLIKELKKSKINTDQLDQIPATVMLESLLDEPTE